MRRKGTGRLIVLSIERVLASRTHFIPITFGLSSFLYYRPLYPPLISPLSHSLSYLLLTGKMAESTYELLELLRAIITVMPACC